MRRIYLTLMGDLGIDGKLMADQCGHALYVSQNVYRQTPIASRLPAVNQLEKRLLVMWMEYIWSTGLRGVFGRR